MRYSLAVKDNLVPLVHGVDCEPSYFIAGGSGRAGERDRGIVGARNGGCAGAGEREGERAWTFL